MNLTVNNVNFKGQKYIILGKENTNVPYLYNKVVDTLNGQHVPAVYETGKDVITMSPFSEKVAKIVCSKLEEFGIKLSKEAK